MRKSTRNVLAVMALLAVSGCASLPTGPSVRVLPAPGKPFETFMADDNTCRHYAAMQIGEGPADTTNRHTASGAAVGTLIGAGAGAAIGAAFGSPGAGAAIGGGSGLLFGSASGANAGEVYGAEAQRRYDNTYVQCMYAKGNQIPVSRGYRSAPSGAPPDYYGR
jgi:hypothetical protein